MNEFTTDLVNQMCMNLTKCSSTNFFYAGNEDIFHNNKHGDSVLANYIEGK